MSREVLSYLDHIATTPLLPEIVDAMLLYLREHFGKTTTETKRGLVASLAIETGGDR